MLLCLDYEQERGDTVSGGWDPDAGARRTVTLPPLSVEQVRRPEYFYPTRAEAEQRLEKLRERERRLDAKRAALEKIKVTGLIKLCVWVWVWVVFVCLCYWFG